MTTKSLADESLLYPLQNRPQPGESTTSASAISAHFGAKLTNYRKEAVKSCAEKSEQKRVFFSSGDSRGNQFSCWVLYNFVFPLIAVCFRKVCTRTHTRKPEGTKREVNVFLTIVSWTLTSSRKCTSTYDSMVRKKRATESCEHLHRNCVLMLLLFALECRFVA